MADFRTVKTSMWAQDEWFMDLPIDGKLLWIYVFTNSHTSVAGIYKLPMRTIVFETGLERGRIQELLKLFEQEQKAFFEDGVIWVSKMRDHQATSSDQVAKRIRLDVEALPDTPLKRKYCLRYGINTVSIPYLQSSSDTDTDTVTDKRREEEETPPPDFQTIMTSQYEEVIGMIPTASYPEMLDYMRKLNSRGVGDWWGLALKETTQAQRPGWQYMKAVLSSWLAAGVPNSGKRNGTDPTIRRGAPSEFTAEERAAADARQEAYERQFAEELARAGKL